MIQRHIVLHHGTQMRDCILGLYRNYDRAAANEIVRRMVWEIGEAVSDLHSRQDAGQMLYAAADAVTVKLPVESFNLPNLPGQQPVAPPPKDAPPKPIPADAPPPKKWLRGPLGRLLGAMCDRFFIGFVLGMIGGANR